MAYYDCYDDYYDDNHYDEYRIQDYESEHYLNDDDDDEFQYRMGTADYLNDYLKRHL